MTRTLSVLLLCLSLVGCVGASGHVDPLSYGAVGEGPSSSDPSKQQAGLQVVSYLPPPPNTDQGADQPIAPDDVLEIDFFQVDKLDRTIRVDSRGNISLALVGSIQAAGKTVPDLQADIERAYGARYLQDPQVSVFVKEFAGQQVTVDGAVNKPGVYPVASSATLLQVIAQAGGFQDIADDAKVYVFRQYGSKKAVANFDVRDIRNGKHQDPRIFGGDVIVSFRSGGKVAMKNLKEALSIATSAAVIARPF